MNNKIIFLSLVILFVVGCAQEPTEEKKPSITGATVSSDVLEKGDKTAKQDVVEEVEEEKEIVEEDVNDLNRLLKNTKPVKSIFYKYKGPETELHYFEFYVKGDKVKYLPLQDEKWLEEEESYNAIYFDTVAKSAEAYCDEQQCVYKGKKGDLNYGKYYILTPYDLLDMITTSKEKGGELIGKRETWKLDTNIGTVWVDTTYGMPLQALMGNKKYEFNPMAFNTVRDSDVVSG